MGLPPQAALPLHSHHGFKVNEIHDEAAPPEVESPIRVFFRLRPTNSTDGKEAHALPLQIDRDNQVVSLPKPPERSELRNEGTTGRTTAANGSSSIASSSLPTARLMSTAARRRQ